MRGAARHEDDRFLGPVAPRAEAEFFPGFGVLGLRFSLELPVGGCEAMIQAYARGDGAGACRAR